MRIARRLVLPHLLVAMIFGIALGFFVYAFARIAALTNEIQRDYLVDLEDEQALHRAAWEVELAIRRGQVACKASPENEGEASRGIVIAGDKLAAELHKYPDGAFEHVGRAAQSYRAFASNVAAEGACKQLAASSASGQELALDEELTNAWIARVTAIGAAFSERETETRNIGVRAAIEGGALALLAGIAAAAIALRTARGMSESLAQLAQYARRVGEGDFTPLAAIAGADEIRSLALDLDRMRARLAEVDQLKHAFVASVSHDLRTPLARLREALALLADEAAGPLNERQRRVVALARIACEREIRMVSALLDLSRLRSGRPIQRTSGSSVDQIVRNAVEEVSEAARELAVTIEVDAPGDAPRGALDGVLIERAVANVLSNAVSVSGRGTAVRITRRILPPDGELRDETWAEVEICDDGPGVEPSLRRRIFEPFGARTAGEAPDERRGVGLGLSIAREMLRAHGGDVVLIDDDRQGATFCIRLPLGERAGANVLRKREKEEAT